jgi:hypothetical protein
MAEFLGVDVREPMSRAPFARLDRWVMEGLSSWPVIGCKAMKDVGRCGVLTKTDCISSSGLLRGFLGPGYEPLGRALFTGRVAGAMPAQKGYRVGLPPV